MRQGQEGWRTSQSMARAATLESRVTSVPARPTRRRLAAVGAAILKAGSELRRVEWSLMYIGFMAYIFVTTTYRLPIATAAMVVGLVGLLLKPDRVRVLPAVIYFGLYLAWAALGLVTSQFPSAVSETLIDMVKVGAVLLVAVSALRTRPQIRFFMVFFLACFASHPARGTIINYLTGNADFGRAAWNHIFANPNDMAALTLLQLSIAVALVMTEPKGIIRLGALASVVVLPVVILLTQSRGVFLGMAVFTLLAVWGQRRRARSFGIAVALTAVAAVFAPSGVWDRVQGLSNATDVSNLRAVDKEGSAQQRFAIWTVATKVIKESPIMGAGIGAYPYANASFSRKLGKRDAHSTYLKVLAETGVPGFLLMMTLLGGTIVRAERARRRLKNVIPAGAQQLRYLELGLIGFLVAGIFGSYDKLSFLYVHIALVWALAEVCERERRQTERLVMGDAGAAAPRRG